MFDGIFANRKVLVTGHTGFKGSWLCFWLTQLGAKVAGFSLGIPTQPANFEVLRLDDKIQSFLGDIRTKNDLIEVIQKFQPEIVFHLAAQSLVRKSYSDPVLTFETNSLGTLNVLECFRQVECVKVGVIITSDKCYRNQEWTWGYRENDALGGDDPYSASKGCSEIICQSYFRSFFLPAKRPFIATTRAGNVIGGGDWAPDRIVPDCVKAWSQFKPVFIRQPNSTRPWQHVLEPLSGYLLLASKLWQACRPVFGEAFNFGPDAKVNQSVGDLISEMASHWPKSEIQLDPNGCTAKPESTLLKLCCDKAMNFLNWHATLNFQETVKLTVDWYKNYYSTSNSSMSDFTSQQISFFIEKAKERQLAWTK